MTDLQELKNDIYDFNDPEKQCRAAYQMRYVRNNPEVIHILFQCCYEAKSPNLQKEAVKSLGVLAPEKAFEAFSKMANNTDPEKQCRACYFLGHLGDVRATESLLKGLRHPEMKVRKAAVISLGRLGRGYREINALNALLNPHEPEPIRTEVQRSIQYIRTRMGKGANADAPSRSFNRPERPVAKAQERKSLPKKADLPKAF